MKKIYILFLTLSSVALLSACGSSQNSNTENFAFRRPDFGQPERRPDISGIVKSVIGNEVTLIKIETPTREQDNTENESSESQARPNQNPAFRGGGPGGLNFFGGGRPPSDQDEESRAAIVERLKAMSTGEEKVLIPIGIRMLKFNQTSETQTPEMLEATLSDIVPDKMLRIWLDENTTDKKVAAFVFIAR